MSSKTAADDKICALEQASKIDELQTRANETEAGKNHLIAQLQGPMSIGS